MAGSEARGPPGVTRGVCARRRHGHRGREDPFLAAPSSSAPRDARLPFQGIARATRAIILDRSAQEVAALSTVTRIAWILLFVVPPLQWAVERSVAWPVAPSRLLAIALWLAAWGPVAASVAGRAGPRGRSGPARAALLVLAPLVGAALLLGVVRLSGGPFGPIPGGRLRGIESPERQPDWRRTDAVRYVALELASGRSLEMLCVRAGSDLYVAANYPETKRWPHEVRREPDVVVRVGRTLHPRRAVFVDDDARRRELLRAMNDKYGFDVSLGTGRVWFFRLDPRLMPRGPAPRDRAVPKPTGASSRAPGSR